MVRISGLLTAFVLAASVLPTTAATAAAPAPWDRSDPLGDAPPRADILHGHTHWEGKSIVIRADVRDLAPTGRFRASLEDDAETIHVFIKKTPTATKRFVLNYSFDGTHEKIPCKHISVQWNARDDFVLVRAPLRSCVDSGPWGTDGLWLKGPEGAVDKVGKIWWVGD
jgi:hypothetical protein